VPSCGQNVGGLACVFFVGLNRPTKADRVAATVRVTIVDRYVPIQVGNVRVNVDLLRAVACNHPVAGNALDHGHRPEQRIDDMVRGHIEHPFTHERRELGLHAKLPVGLGPIDVRDSEWVAVLQ